MNHSVGDRVYWRSMDDVLHSGEILEIDVEHLTCWSMSAPYLVRPDGECMGAPYFLLWMSGHRFMRLPETIETSVD